LTPRAAESAVSYKREGRPHPYRLHHW